MNPRIAVAWIALAYGLACVAHATERVDFKPPADAPIRKIAILAVAIPRQVIVENRNPAGLLPGAIIQGVRTGKYSETYAAEMNSHKMLLAPELADALKRELGRKYEIVFINERPKANLDNSPNYGHIQTDADAVLHIFYGQVGYKSLDMETDYLPVVAMGTRLMDARTFKTLYYRQFIVQPSPENVRGGREALPADRRYSYASVARLLAAFEESYRGLLASQEAIVSRIARDLDVPAQPEEKPAEAGPSDPKKNQ